VGEASAVVKRMDPREIQRLEELCIQDEAPWCQAACPLHIDVRGMLKAIAQGDFETGARIYAKKVPFPGILSRICDQPCRAVCKRGEAGDPLQIGLLERSLAHYGGFTPELPRHGFPRQERIAVVGGGLSGLTAALELAKKHYEVTIFETSDRVGGRLRLLPPGVLPPEILEEELRLLERGGVELRTGLRLGRDVTLAELTESYDAVYLSVGNGEVGGAMSPDGGPGTGGAAKAGGAPEPGAVGPGDAALRGAEPPGTIDPVTLQTPCEKVFAGGSMRRETEAYSPVSSVSDGLRAAVSIDRFLKRESLSSGREKEGPYPSCLYTSLEGIDPVPAVLPEGPRIGYSREEALAEAARCLQCECLECVKACTYLEHFHEYPGKCIRKVTKNIISLPGKSYRTFTPFLNACSLCGLCGTVCPTDLNMAVVNSEARRIMCDKEFMPPAIHDFAIRDMESSNAASSGMARNQPGHDSSSYLFFPGCQLAASAPHNVERTYRYLTERLTGGVGLALGCCGAPAAWAGRQEHFQEVLSVFTRQWTDMKQPRVILACPTCSLMFKQSLPDVPAVSLWEIFDQEGLPDDAPRGRGEKLALHDSCTARLASEIQDSARSLIRKLGYQVEELPYSREMTKCCGYGGLMYLVNRGLTEKVVESRIEESFTDYLTYCTNCRDLFADKGKASYHLLDLIFDGYPGGAARPGPTLSQRKENRRRLVSKMLSELWGEAMPEQEEYTKLTLRIPADVAAKMEKDYILVDDVRQVIHQAEKTGNKLAVPATGRFIAHYRPSLVTYWVEYAPEGDEYEIFNAYSHRMQIVEDVSQEMSRDENHDES
jgi:glutamate synthase (NADPH/NADH) small chain